MAFAAPVVAEMAGGAAASGAGSAVASGAGAGAAAKVAPKAAPKAAAKPARKAAPKAAPRAATAPDRARQLIDSGTSRKDAARILRDEYGSTLAEAEGLLPAEPSSATSTPPASPAPAPDRSAPSLPSVPRGVRSAANAGGGALLGALTYIIALTYLRDGKPGVTRWLRAKFLNQVSSPATTPKAAARSGFDGTASTGSGTGGGGGVGGW